MAKLNRGRDNARKREWRSKNKAKVRSITLKYRYGISEQEFQIRLSAQNGLCAICQTAPGTDVDHDHVTGKIRGILCGSCNRGVGLFKDDAELLSRATDYVRLWSV
jgi:hypothetical protein